MLVNVNLRQQQCADTLLLLLLLLVCGQVPLLVGPGVRTIFVASDDSQWVEQQIKLVERTDPLWNIVTLAAPKPPKHLENGRNGGSEPQSSSRDPVFDLGEEPYAGYYYMRSQGGTASGTYLMASMVRASFIFLGGHKEFLCLDKSCRSMSRDMRCVTVFMFRGPYFGSLWMI